MSPQQKTLTHLYEELRIIQLFDRIHDYATAADPAHERAYVLRQARRKEVIDEIANLKATTPDPSQSARVTGAVALVCAIGYAMLYLLR